MNVSFNQGRHGGLGMFGIDIIGLKEMGPNLIQEKNLHLHLPSISHQLRL